MWSEVTDWKSAVAAGQDTLFHTAHALSAHPSSDDSSDISNCVKALNSDCRELSLSLTPCCLQLLLVNTSSTVPSIACCADSDLRHQPGRRRCKPTRRVGWLGDVADGMGWDGMGWVSGSCETRTAQVQRK